MLTLDELRGVLNCLKMCEAHKKVMEAVGVPLGVDVLRDFYGLAARVVGEIQKAEAEKELNAKKE